MSEPITSENAVARIDSMLWELIDTCAAFPAESKTGDARTWNTLSIYSLSDDKRSLRAIDDALRGNVCDPSPLPPLHAHAAIGAPTTYGLVMGLLRERDALRAQNVLLDKRVVELGVLVMQSLPK